MLFLVPNEVGKIIQANKVYDVPTDDYLGQMETMQHGYVALDNPGLISPDKWWVRDMNLTERPLMQLTVSKQSIKAGGNDTVVVTGAPKGCKFSMEVNIPGVGITIPHAGVLDDGELEVSMDMPCLFTLKFELWPHRDTSVVIEAYS